MSLSSKAKTGSEIYISLEPKTLNNENIANDVQEVITLRNQRWVPYEEVRQTIDDILKDFPMNLFFKHRSETLDLATTNELMGHHNQSEVIRARLLNFIGIHTYDDILPNHIDCVEKDGGKQS